jgi:hypothetical protein
VLLLRGWLCGVPGGGQVEQDHGVVVGGARLGEVDAEALAGRAFQVGGVGIGTGQRAQPGNTGADLVVPVGIDVTRRGVEEQEPADVPVGGRPVV